MDESDEESLTEANTLAAAVEALWKQGIVVVVGAGNRGPACGTIDSPGTARSVITVGAVDDRAGWDALFAAPFSARSRPGEHKPEILAPGVDIVSTSISKEDAGYTTMTGTSMAAPIVAGCAALLVEQDPSLTPDEVKAKMLSYTMSVGFPDFVQGCGMLQMEDAIRMRSAIIKCRV
jgi:serine protease AprX